MWGKWAKMCIKMLIVREGEIRQKSLSKHGSRESGKVTEKTGQVLGCPLHISSITPVLPIAVTGTDVINSSLILSFGFQVHIRLYLHIETCLNSCARVAFAKRKLQKGYSAVQCLVCRVLYGTSDSLVCYACVRACVPVFVCYLECLWGQYCVISMTMEQTDADSPIPILRPKATKLMVVECDHSYEMLCAFMCKYSEYFFALRSPVNQSK
jgi:hypothetical protein